MPSSDFVIALYNLSKLVLIKLSSHAPSNGNVRTYFTSIFQCICNYLSTMIVTANIMQEESVCLQHLLTSCILSGPCETIINLVISNIKTRNCMLINQKARSHWLIGRERS